MAEVILTDKFKEIADAIRTKKETTAPIVANDFPSEILSIKIPKLCFTGHADVEGLKAIGWTDKDIEYYQIYGVNWNEEDDKYHKVPQDNIDLYGVIDATNISTYKDILVYLPKIDTSTVINFRKMFEGCKSLVGIPLLDTNKGTTFEEMFYGCYSLIYIPPLHTSNGTAFGSMFTFCYSLMYIPKFDISKARNISNIFTYCYALVSSPLLDTSNLAGPSNLYSSCYSLVHIPLLDLSKATFNYGNMFLHCVSLKYFNIKGLRNSIEFPQTAVTIDKDSLLFMINESLATKAITIKLNIRNYNIYSIDPDVIAALTNKPFISITSV